MKRTTQDALRNPVLGGIIPAVLAPLFTAGSRMRPLAAPGVAVFLGAQNAHEGLLKGSRSRSSLRRSG